MPTKPKKKPSPRNQMRIDLDKPAKLALVKCYRLMLDEPDVMHPPTRNQVIGWALRKCAGEARE